MSFLESECRMFFQEGLSLSRTVQQGSCATTWLQLWWHSSDGAVYPFTQRLGYSRGTSSHSHSLLPKLRLQVFSGFGGFLIFYYFFFFLIASTMQVSCKAVRQVLNDYGHPAAQSNPVRELCCWSGISKKEVAGSQA